jgi:hypothetical protein
MKTSSDHHPSTPQPRAKWAGGEHWFEMTATLSPQSKAKFGKWIDEELAHLEDEFDRFVTPNSRGISQRRGS